MPKFRKKPVIIEARQWDGTRSSVEDISRWVNDFSHEAEPIMSYIFTDEKDVQDVLIWTLEGDHKVSPHDWIIKGVKNEFYPCKPDIFEQTYEPVE